jgi:hypothetical protein
MIKLIASEGSSLRTANVERSNAETHIAANDRFANEARCLLAWEADDSEREPIAWDGERLIFSGSIGDAEPVKVIWE